MANYQDVTNSAEIMTYVYDSRSHDTLNNETPTYSKFKKSPFQPGGLGFVTSVKVRRNQRIGDRDEAEALPATGYLKYQNPTVTPKYSYALAEVTGQAKAKAQNRNMAFEELISLIIEDTITSFARNKNKQCFRNGRNTLAVTSAAATSTSLVLGAPNYEELLEVGMWIDAAPSGSTTVSIDNKEITAIVTSTHTATIGSSTWASGDEVILAGTRDTTLAKGILGFDTMFAATGTYMGVSRDTYPQWAGNVDSGSSVNRLVKMTVLDAVYNKIRRSVGAKKIGKLELIMNDGQETMLADIVLPGQRYVNTNKFDIGQIGLTYKGKHNVSVDTDTPRNAIYFVNWDTVERQILLEGTWSDLGEMWFSHHGLSTAYDKFTACWKCYEELFCNNPHANGLANYLTEPS